MKQSKSPLANSIRTDGSARCLSRVYQGWDKDTQQDRDKRNRYQYFGKGETSSLEHVCDPFAG
jgi:hypothetical protein